MSKPADIPKDIHEIAKAVNEALWALTDTDERYDWDTNTIAFALLAERNRCAAVAKEQADKAKESGLTHEALGAYWVRKSILKDAP